MKLKQIEKIPTSIAGVMGGCIAYVLVGILIHKLGSAFVVNLVNAVAGGAVIGAIIGVILCAAFLGGYKMVKRLTARSANRG